MMNKIFRILSITILFLPFLGCTQEKKYPKKNDSKKNFEEKLKNKPKIFLKYWSEMTSNEFQKVSEILKNEEVLNNKGGLYYKMGKDELCIKSFKFSDNYYNSFIIDCNGKRINKNSIDIVDGIELSGFDEATYNIFKEKYGLPNCIYQESAKFILEENPLYNNPNAKEYEKGKEIKVLDENEIKDIFELHKNPEWFFLGYVPELRTLTIKNDIVIQKENAVILFKVCKDICGRENPYNKAWFYYKNNDKNSSHRIVAIPNFSILTATYIDKEIYRKAKEKMINTNNNILKKSQIEEKKIKKRKQEVKDEI